jgi:hypothetical protein
MTTTKPRTEVPKITTPADQDFMLTREEVSIACAEYVIRNRKDCRFGLLMPWNVYGSHGSLTITIKDGHKK